MRTYESDFVFITALVEPEFSALRNVITRFGGNMKPIALNSSIEHGTLKAKASGKDLHFFAAAQSSPGMVSAATLAAKMIERFRPRYLVMLGIAAGTNRSKFQPGDVLIADFVANYQSGKATETGFQPDGAGVPLDSDLRTRFLREKDSIMAEINNSSVRSLRAHVGPIVAGNQVVASQAIIDGIKGTLRKTVGVEMEGFAIFQAAVEADVPRPIPILIKSVCDYGDELKDDQYQRLAAHTSAEFFVRFALQHLAEGGVDAQEPRVQVIPLRKQRLRGAQQFLDMLDHVRPGACAKFISITGRSNLVPAPYANTLDGDPLDRAVERGVRIRGILCDPTCREADTRSKFESPKVEQKELRLLMRDAKSVSEQLENRSALWRRNVQLRYSETGLSFKLWLFEEGALVEPYHFGKLLIDRSKAESALCGFSHLWIQPGALEYEILLDHFNQLWRSCAGSRWPPASTKEAH